MKTKAGAMLLAVAASLLAVFPFAETQGNSDNSSGSNSSEVPDTEEALISEVKKAEKKGTQSESHTEALLALGRHYIRNKKFVDAARVLKEDLAILDSGAVKASPSPEKLTDKQARQGSSGNAANPELSPRDLMKAQILSSLVGAEIRCGEPGSAESHLNRLASILGTDEIKRKLTLRSAYFMFADYYAENHQSKEAEIYRQRAEKINESL